MGKYYYCVACRENSENIPPTNTSLTFFQFPNSPTRRKKWVTNLGLVSQITTRGKICQLHFKRDQIVRLKLRAGAEPTIKIPETKPQSTKTAEKTALQSSSKWINQINRASNQSLPLPNYRPILPKPSTKIPQKSIDETKQKLTKYKRKIRNLETSVSHLRTSLAHSTNLNEDLKENPTFLKLIKSQINRYKNKRKCYSDFEKTTAISLYYACGRNGYRSLLKLGFKLPSVSSLVSWISSFKLNTGINRCLMDCIKEMTKDFKGSERDCILTWDEMSIKELIEYNRFCDMFEGVVDFGEFDRDLQSANEVLVFMVQGIKCCWKFPVSFYFSNNATITEYLQKCFTENFNALLQINLSVRIGICDMSFTNQAMYKSWGITASQPFRFIEGQKVYFINDTPHLVKLVRNNLMKHNFTWKQSFGSCTSYLKVKWAHIVSLFRKDTRISSRMAPRLTTAHIFLKDYSKRKVRLAVQVLSHSVYAAMLTMIRLKILSRDTKHTALFIKRIDELFDFLNISKVDNDKKSRCGRYYFNNWNRVDEYLKFLSDINIPTLPREPEFLRGFKQTIIGVKLLSEDLREEGYKYILTRRLQQDCLENFFSAIRMRGGFCRNPTARQFRCNFRYLFFSSLVSFPSTGNVQSVENDTYNNSFPIEFVKRKNISVGGNDHCNDSEITVARASAFFSIKLKRKLKLGTEQEQCVSEYIGCAGIRSVVKKIDCISCEQLLKSSPSSTRSSSILIDYKQYDPNEPHLLYLDIETKNVFETLNRLFPSVLVNTLNKTGNAIVRNIMQTYYDNHIIRYWVDVCFDHRISVVKYFVRLKLFRLMKDKNDLVKKVKCWQQTRRDLRNQ